MAYNFENTGAFTLFINYDTAILKFDSITRKHILFDKIKINEFKDSANNSIAISWYDIYGASFDSLKIFEVCFSSKQGNTSIYFTDNCEVSRTDLHLVPTNFVAGTIAAHIRIYNQPFDTVAYFNESVFYFVKISPGALAQWEISTDNGNSFNNLEDSDFIYGVHNDTLRILYCDTSLNNTLYRCKLEKNGCTVYTNPAKLTVLIPEADQFEVQFDKGWNSFSSFLNPGNPWIDSTFSEITDHLIYIGDGQRNYFPQAGDNTLRYFNSLSGYQIKVTDNVSFEFSGYQKSHHTLRLNKGWNLMPILTSCNISIWQMDSVFLNQVEIIKDAVGMNVFWPDRNISSLQALEPGKSYFTKLKSEIEINFPECEN